MWPRSWDQAHESTLEREEIGHGAIVADNPPSLVNPPGWSSPLHHGTEAIPTTGLFRLMLPVEPWKAASP